MERYYDAEGVLTDSGVVVARWQETREGAEGGTLTYTFLRYRFVDQEGRPHEHVVSSQHRRWEELPPGSRLPTIEYLASDPGTHRYASERGMGPRLVQAGLILLAVILPFRILYGLATWRVHNLPRAAEPQG